MIPLVEQRSRVVSEALTWVGTPFQMNGRVKGKGGGVDCFTLMASVWKACALSAPWEAEFYHGDWWCHDTRNSYLRTILKYAKQVPDSGGKLPGNLILVRRQIQSGVKTVDWHGAIIVRWPLVVHAYSPRVAEDNCLAHPAFQTSGGLVFFDPFSHEAQR